MGQPPKSKRSKTFPLEIREDLHKALKHRAIETDQTLHSYIIEALVFHVKEEDVGYQGSSDNEVTDG